MGLLNTDQLEKAVYGLSLIGSCGFGWVGWIQSQKNRIEEKMADEKTEREQHEANDVKLFDAQWKRIDEIKDQAARRIDFEELRRKTDQIQATYISKDYHENFRREFKDDMRDAMKEAIVPLSVAVQNLSDRLDRVVEKRN